jgi:DNA-binding transcriptional MerR regulator
MPISQDEFKNLRQAGYSIEKIAEFSRKRDAQSNVSRETTQPIQPTETKSDKRPQDMTALDKLHDILTRFGETPTGQGIQGAAKELSGLYKSPIQTIKKGYNQLNEWEGQAKQGIKDISQAVQHPVTTAYKAMGRPEEQPEWTRTAENIVQTSPQVRLANELIEATPLNPVDALGYELGGKAIGMAIKSIPATALGIKKLFTSEPKIAEEARNLYKDAELAMKQKFGSDLVEMSRVNIGNNNINVTPMVDKVISNLKKQGIAPSKIKKAVKDYPALQKMISSEEPLKTAKLGELQDLKNSLNKTFSEAKKQGKNLTDAEYQLYKTVDDIDESIVNHYEQYAPAKSEYSRKIKDLKILKGLTKEGKTFKNLKEIWNNKETREVLKRVFPDEFVNQFGNREKFNSFLKWGGAILGATALGKAGQVGWNAFNN